MEFTTGVLVCIIVLLALAYYYKATPPCQCPTCAAATATGSKQERFCPACMLPAIAVL